MSIEKIKTQERAIQIAEKLRKQNRTIVTTNGSFDILHSAHIYLFEKARQYGDDLFVLLNSDDSVRENKGDKRPIVPQNQRAYVLSAVETVDYVTIFEEDTPLELLRQLKPHIHVKGGTYIPERVKAEEDLLKTWGGKFVALEEELGLSTTNIIERILNIYGNNF